MVKINKVFRAIIVSPAERDDDIFKQTTINLSHCVSLGHFKVKYASHLNTYN